MPFGMGQPLTLASALWSRKPRPANDIEKDYSALRDCLKQATSVAQVQALGQPSF